MEIVIKHNIDDMVKKLNMVQRQQVPFAMSRAMNDTAIDAQTAVVGRAATVFNNRKKWWIKGSRRTGIRVDFSNKRNLVAAVYSNAYFADLQEEGGIKRPIGRKLAVPTGKTPKRLHKSDGVRKAKQDSKVFSDRRGVFRRMARNRLKLLFTWTSQAVVPMRFGFMKTAKNRAQQRIRRHFARRLKQALRTAKL